MTHPTLTPEAVQALKASCEDPHNKPHFIIPVEMWKLRALISAWENSQEQQNSARAGFAPTPPVGKE